MSTSDIMPGNVIEIKGYITTMLDCGVEEISVDEIAQNTPVPKTKVRTIMEQMARQPGTGVEHIDNGESEDYEIERRG